MANDPQLFKHIERQALRDWRRLKDADHGRGIGKRTGGTAVVQRRIAEELNVLVLDLYVEGAWADEGCGALDVHRHDAPAAAHRRNVTAAEEARALDGDGMTLDREWGDVGAASGALLTILAVQAWQRSYAKGDVALAWSSSDGGLRSAAVLERSY